MFARVRMKGEWGRLLRQTMCVNRDCNELMCVCPSWGSGQSKGEW